MAHRSCDDSEQARWVKTVKVHCRGIAKSPVDQTVGRTCAMIIVITQRIWDIYASKEDPLFYRYRLGHLSVDFDMQIPESA